MENEFIYCTPPNSNPNEYADYLVNFLKKIMNKYFPIRHKTITQRRLHSPWISSDIMKCIRKKHRWFRLMRRGLISYNSFKLYAKKLRLLLRTAREQYYVRRLDSLNYDVKRNWKVLNSLMGKNKKSLHKEFIVDGVSTNDTTKICDAFCNYFIDHQRNIHESIPISISHH